MTDPKEIIDDLIKSGDHKKLTLGTKFVYKTNETIINPTFYDYSLDSSVKLFNPPVRKHHMSCLVGNYLYIYGGIDENNNIMGDFYKINLINNSWTQLPINGDNPGPRAMTDMVLYNGKIYMVSGNNDKKVFSYDLSNSLWSEIIISNPKKIVQHSTVIYQNWLYIIGGRSFTKSRGKKRIFYFDLTSPNPTWIRTSADLRTNLFGHKATIIGNELFVFFGYKNMTGRVYKRVCLNTINSFTGDISGTFQRLPRGIDTGLGRIEPLARGEFSLSKIGTDIYLYGGKRTYDGQVFDGQLSIYDTNDRSSTAWISIIDNYLVDQKIPPQPVANRAGTSMTFFSDAQSISNIYLFGGYSSNGVLYSDFRDIIENDIKDTIKGTPLFIGLKTFDLNGFRFEVKSVNGYAVIMIEPIAKTTPLEFFSLRIYTPP